MFPDPKRSKPQRTLEQVTKDAHLYVEETVKANPKLPSGQIGALAASQIPLGLRVELADFWMIEFCIREVRSIRRKEPKPAPALFPGFEHLPRRIEGKRGKLKPLGDATAEDLAVYIKTLSRLRPDREERRKEAMKLRERLQRRNQRGITVREVLSLGL